MPRSTSCSRPVSYIDHDIIVIAITLEYRKTQVVTHLWQDPKAVYLEYLPFSPGNHMVAFFAQTKQMPFIVMAHRTIRPAPVKTIGFFLALCHQHATRNNGLPALCLTL